MWDLEHTKSKGVNDSLWLPDGVLDTTNTVIESNGTSLSHRLSFSSFSYRYVWQSIDCHLKIPLCSEHVTFSARKNSHHIFWFPCRHHHGTALRPQCLYILGFSFVYSLRHSPRSIRPMKYNCHQLRDKKKRELNELYFIQLNFL